MLKFGYGTECGNVIFTNQTFDFHFKLEAPKARKEREIIERDYLGGIVSSKVPELLILYV